LDRIKGSRSDFGHKPGPWLPDKPKPPAIAARDRCLTELSNGAALSRQCP
jgi:hypothetical protein